jgi:hypothetical protein
LEESCIEQKYFRKKEFGWCWIKEDFIGEEDFKFDCFKEFSVGE